MVYTVPLLLEIRRSNSLAPSLTLYFLCQGYLREFEPKSIEQNKLELAWLSSRAQHGAVQQRLSEKEGKCASRAWFDNKNDSCLAKASARR